MQFNLLRFSRALVKTLFGLNIIFAALLFLCLLWWTIAPGMIEEQLIEKYGSESGVAMLDLIRFVLLLGTVAALPAGILLQRLVRMIDAVGAGTPFASTNVEHIRMIAWMVLILQLLDLVFAFAGMWADRLAADWVSWSPSIMGWLVVLLLFVLARIFAAGAAMEADLEGTV